MLNSTGDESKINQSIAKKMDATAPACWFLATNAKVFSAFNYNDEGDCSCASANSVRTVCKD